MRFFSKKCGEKVCWKCCFYTLKNSKLEYRGSFWTRSSGQNSILTSSTFSSLTAGSQFRPKGLQKCGFIKYFCKEICDRSLSAWCSKNHNLVDFQRIELVPVPKFHKLSWLHFHRRNWVQTVFKKPSFFAQSAWHAENPACWILFHRGRNFEKS